MTVSYQYEVASSTSGGFTRLLFMWRGSLYKLIYRELFLFLIIFGAISAAYRHLLTADQKRSFEQIVVYCDTFINLIPLSFVLGFYVAYVAGRWWQQYTAIPWPDKVMHSVALYVIGNDEYGRMLRRALMRYLNLSLILVLRSISSAVKRRFPTLDHVVELGFMTALEKELFLSVPSLEFNTYWIPCTWFINLLKEARTNHRLPDPQGLKIIMEEFNDFRSKCGMLWSYDWVSIPLVYTQVVTLATYSFFAVALVGRQYIEGVIKPFQMKVDIYFPVFTVLQFFFFMGLLKVAEQLINPFGDDDEDFELNWIIDRHTKVSYLGVDTLMNRCPPLVKDIYYDSEDLILPYTEAAAAYKRKTYRGSVANMTVPEEKQTMFLPNILEEDEGSREMTPRASNLTLASNNDSPNSNARRQGDSSPKSSRRVDRSTGETIVTLDLREDQLDQDQFSSTDQSSKSAMKSKSNSLMDAVKTLTGKSKLLDQRKPFFCKTKLTKVSIQPWPSATNLKSNSVIDSDLDLGEGNRQKLRHTRSFNIPSIDVRQSSVDYTIDEDDDFGGSGFESVEMTARTRLPPTYDSRGIPISRGFLSRSSRVEEPQEHRCICELGSSSSGGAGTSCCCHDSCYQRQRQQTPTPSFRSKKKPRAGRFNSFPKFLSRRNQRSTVQRVSAGRRNQAFEENLTVSKSSPELRVCSDFDASTSFDQRTTRSRPRFFTGTEDEEDDDDEVQDVIAKMS